LNVSPEEDVDGSAEVLISAIEHYSYCPRQCAIIHVEQTFEDNVFTTKGHLAHARVDESDATSAKGIAVLRSIDLWSDRLRLRGKADVVEMRPAGPYPVEYKVGPRRGLHADLQLCAQAMCLEEMFRRPVPRGAVYSHATRSRAEVTFTPDMRARTEAVIASIREMLECPDLPAAPNDRRCVGCSLAGVCLPSVVARPAPMRSLQTALFRPLPLPGPEEGDRP
jgi:CRISPR-associated exonuclease Cas4